jgi:hypothetical protein
MVIGEETHADLVYTSARQMRKVIANPALILTFSHGEKGFAWSEKRFLARGGRETPLPRGEGRVRAILDDKSVRN